METAENHKEPSQKKSYIGLLGWLMWWNIDKEDIQKQAKEYNWNIFHSTRRIFVVLMLGWIILTNFILPSSITLSLIGLFITLFYSFLSFLIYKGKQLPMIIMMFFFTIDRGYALYDMIASGRYNAGSAIFVVLLWSVFMRMLYVSYKVEVERFREHNHDNKIGSVNLFLKKPLNVAILVVCIAIITYFGILIIKEVQPKSNSEKQMDCLKLGSDFARRRCLLIINNK